MAQFGSLNYSSNVSRLFYFTILFLFLKCLNFYFIFGVHEFDTDSAYTLGSGRWVFCCSLAWQDLLFLDFILDFGPNTTGLLHMLFFSTTYLYMAR